MSRIKIVLAVVGLAVVGTAAGVLIPTPNDTPSINVEQPVNTPTAAAPPEPAGFDKTRLSLTDPASLWVIANKTRPLPDDYVPADLTTPKVTLNTQKTAEENQLRSEAARALEELFAAAAMNGNQLMLASGYRSYRLQNTYYTSYVARDGQAAADRYSARPGTSEHQTGWALDIAPTDRRCYLETCFADTKEGQWLAANAHLYGFTLRYPDGQEAVTGYQYEPWHFRYFGRELAQEIQASGKTVEEYFAIKTL